MLDDAGSIYAEIPDCKCAYPKGNSFEECRSNLIEVLEEWVFIRLRYNINIPIINNIDLNIIETANAAY